MGQSWPRAVYLTGDWKSHDSCLEIAENALAEYMSPQQDPGTPERNNRLGDRGDGGTLNRLLESGSPAYFQVHSANGALHGNVFMTVEKEESMKNRNRLEATNVSR